MTPTNIISLKNSFWISPPYWSCYCYCYCFFSSAEGATSGWTKAPASSNIFFNSPDLYKSVTISHPPIKSPLINNWGNVGQSLFSQNAHNLLRILLQILPHRRTCENVGARKVTPYSQNNIEKLPNRFRMFTTRKLNPQRGAVGVPFINNITLFSCTIYFLTPTSSSALYQWISILPPGSRPLPCFWAWSRRPTHLRSETKRTLSEVWNSFWTTVSTAGSPQENDTYYDQIYYTPFFAHGNAFKTNNFNSPLVTIHHFQTLLSIPPRNLYRWLVPSPQITSSRNIPSLAIHCNPNGSYTVALRSKSRSAAATHKNYHSILHECDPSRLQAFFPSESPFRTL